MHKLTMRLQIILIGLSVILLNGCALFSYDPPVEYYEGYFYNKASSEVEIIFKKKEGMTDTILVPSNETRLWGDFAKDDNLPSRQVVEILYDEDLAIGLSTNNTEKQEWIGPSGNFGDSINSPFNYDSWVFEALTPDAKNIVGKITFTITDADLE